MKELFRKLEFRALLKRVDELEEALPGATPGSSDRVEVPFRQGSWPTSVAAAEVASRRRRSARGLGRRVGGAS